MKIHFTGRQIEITEALRRAAEERLSKLNRFMDEIAEAHVILAVEKRRHRAEILLKSRPANLSAAAETGDMYSALSRVGDKLERQAKKRREKLKVERKREGKKASPRRVVTSAAAVDGPRVVSVPAGPLKPMSVEEALLQVSGTEREFLVFRNSASRRISVLYRRRDGNYGIIEPEA